MKKKYLIIFVFIPSLFITQLTAQKFKFIVWGDSQFQNPEVFENIVRETELLSPDFVLHVGDMIHGYTYNIDIARKQWVHFKEQIKPLSVPFYPTPGNHDVTTKEIEPAYIEAWGEDKLYYSFNYENSHFIVLNAFTEQEFYTISEEEYKWLIEDLDDTKNCKNIFISIHPPMYMTDFNLWEKYHQLFLKYPVKAIFTGHSHVYDYRNIDGIDYFCLNSSGNMNIYNPLAGRFHHYLQVSVDENEINYAVISKDGIFSKDFIPPDEYKFSSQYFEENGVIIIPTVTDKNYDTTVFVTIRNYSKEKRIYNLLWETENFDWDFEPWGKTIEIEPKGELKNEFTITIPQGKFNRANYPKLSVKSKYLTSNKLENYTEQCFYLFSPPVTYGYFTDENIELDGKLYEASWSNVSGIENLFIDFNKTPANEKTQVKILYDKKFIYVGIVGEEPNVDGLSAFAYGDIPLVFGDDDFELFFDTDFSKVSFYRLMVNSLGTILCSGPAGLFPFDFEVATFIGEDYWSAEFKIPLDGMNVKSIKVGDTWGFNVRRHRQQAEPNQSDWSKMQTHPPYEPQYFGILKFK
ncbi:MAG: metallophosphoesterase [Ignavibacteriales bacterium]|nr:metallophosphoesterase [Ignavibacteriales bacterium]